MIYGVIAIGALLAAESGRHESYLDTVGSAAIALSLYWLAHAYARVLGHRLQTHERLSATGLGRALLQNWTIARGAASRCSRCCSPGRWAPLRLRASKWRYGPLWRA